MTYFAHAGEAHESDQEAQQHIQQTAVETSSYLGDVITNLMPFAILLAIILFLHFALKTKKSTIVNVALVYLLLVGLTTYSIAPIASIVSLVIGFGLALVVVLGRVKN